MEEFASTLHVIERSEVPAGSFRYGQPASYKGFNVRPDLYAVCTPCSKMRETADGSYDGFDTVLVAHFLSHTFEDAAETARNLSRDGGSVTIVKPNPA